MSIVFIAIVLYLGMLYSKERGEKNHDNYLANIKQTHDKFRKKIENIEIPENNQCKYSESTFELEMDKNGSIIFFDERGNPLV